MTVAELIARLQRLYKPDAVIHAPIWGAEDVQAVAQNYVGHKLTKEQVDRVLNLLEDGHDANYGTTWEHLEQAVDKVLA